MSSGSILSKKIDKILNHDLNDDPDTLEALKCLSDFFIENSIVTRRNLRSNLEKRSLAVNHEFLNSFNQLNQSLDCLCQSVDQMQDILENVQSKIIETKESNLVPFSKVNDLQVKKLEIADKKEVLNRFLQEFQLNQEEINCLNRPIDSNQSLKEFFYILHKIQNIHDKSKTLLVDSDEKTVAIEIMDSMAKYEEQAYEQLYKWLIQSVRALNWETEANLESILIGFGYLQKRKIPYRYCLDEYGVLRRGVIVKHFLTYLNRTQMMTSNSNNNAVSFHSAGDQQTFEKTIAGLMQYLNDAVMNEQRYLQRLLSKCDPKLLYQDNDIKDYLSTITATLCQAGKSRIEQILAFETDCIASYQVRNLLKKYQKVFVQMLNKQSEFMFFLNELCALSHRVFINNLNFFVTYRLGKKVNSEELEEVSSNLSPTCSFVTCNQILARILQFDECLSDVERQELAINVLNISIGSYLNFCAILSKSLIESERNIFMINCLQSILQTLRISPLAKEFADSLSEELEREKIVLSKSQSESILKFCELNTIWQVVQKYDRPMTGLASLPGCDVLSLKDSSRKLNNYLSAYKTFVPAQFLLIKEKGIRLEIERRSRAAFLEAYTKIYEAIHLTENNYEEPDSILPQNPSTVREVLQV